ncbi:MAG: hypothetical protein J3K34DRAFT_459838 [Monoraphidium minutum]|nr:MAG: hypothetical protein J3K34DRAFT_459838 [Monoraphidium minutum]
MVNIVTSPKTYSSIDPQYTGGKFFVPSPLDQRPCATCVAHAVIMAAETAVAIRTNKDVRREISRLSVQDFYWCSPGYRECDTGWSLKEALDELTKRGNRLLTDRCLPYKPEFRNEKAPNVLCMEERECDSVSRVPSLGYYQYKPINRLWMAQRHIRDWGSVVTRFDIHDDFEEFLKNARNKGKVYKPSPGAKVVELHAVVVIGYSDPGQYWVVRNSWGADLGDRGDFKVAYGMCNVLTAGDTYGVFWLPEADGEAVVPKPVTRPSNKPGCVLYKARTCKRWRFVDLFVCLCVPRYFCLCQGSGKAQPGDFLGRVAWRFDGFSIQKLMKDNADQIKDPDAVIEGMDILVCGWKPRSPAPRRSPPSPPPARVPARPPPAGWPVKGLQQVIAIRAVNCCRGCTRPGS